MLSYWIVTVGKLFYAGGLYREITNEKDFSMEFVSNQDHAFQILSEEAAIRIADQTGGTYFKVEVTEEEFDRVLAKHEELYKTSRKRGIIIP
ncbi:hypothetical protein ACSS31_29015 (plasmid) [Priestia megaterium]